ncbi:hypothetical protein ABKW28_01280 [Nocardioides sp. 31GB23]|uniref:beta strand repeat-containing protein n=1 Tax=Nocardioides sp. 31GB23 TaxID=3156065 RepID=UPI0032AFCF5B
MNSSGIKRGLAGSAITALAITGLPFLATSASAQPGQAFESGGDDAVTLIQPTTANVSAQNDGSDSTVRLSASGGADVTSVSFYYTINNAAPVLIGSATRNDNGFFALEWTPTGVAGATVEVFVVSNAAVAADIADLSNQDGKSLTVNNNAKAVEVTDGDAIGVFQAPYGGGAARQQLIFTGTASAGSDPTAFAASWLATTSDAAATDQRTPNYAPGALIDIENTSPANNPATAPESFAGILDLDGYQYPGEDDIFVHVVNGAEGTDGGEGYDLYAQTISEVTADADRTNVPAGQDATVTVTVTDQNDRPIAGARVLSSAGGAAEFTDVNGEATFAQGDGTAYYYADATDNAGYQANFGDERSGDVTVTEFLPAEDSLVANSENGDAFDLDEVDGDDFTVQITDQNDGDIAELGRTVSYYWVLTPFDGTPATQRFPATGTSTALTDNNGEATIAFPTTATDDEGTYELFAELEENGLGQGGIDNAKVLTVKAGEAEVEFDGAEPLTGEAGGDIAVSGELVLDDGTGLPGREVQLDYTGDDAKFDQPTGADNATIVLTTGDDGSFSATLDDVAATGNNAQGSEDGTIDATTNDVDDEGGDADNPNATGSVDVEFAKTTAPAGTTVNITGLANTKPGVATTGSVQLANSTAGADLENIVVTLTVDGDSFFTDGTYVGEEGDQGGDLKDLGQTITLTTDNTGKTPNFQVGVEGSEDFNDDGLAEDIVTATVSTGSDTEDVDYSSANPLNPGELMIDFTENQPELTNVELPLAPVTDDTRYEVTATDQYGNMIDGATVNLSANNGGDVSETSVVTDVSNPPAFELSSDDEADVTPTGSWTATTTELNAAGAPVAGAPETVTEDGPTTEFYEVDYANSTYTLAQQGDENRPVGSTVIMDYTALDQNGEPIEFNVDFFRTGPDEFGDGESNNGNFTGEDGKTSYVFQGASKGTATVTAIGFDLDSGEAVPESQVTDTVTFGPGGGGQVPVEAIISASSNGPKKDVVRFQVDDAAEGATVKLFKIRGKKSEGNKRLVQVREDIVPEGGTLTFKVADRNGNKKTRFIAKVSATEATEKAKSNTQKPR